MRSWEWKDEGIFLSSDLVLVLTLSQTKTEFLLTILIQYQPDKWWK